MCVQELPDEHGNSRCSLNTLRLKSLHVYPTSSHSDVESSLLERWAAPSLCVTLWVAMRGVAVST